MNTPAKQPKLPPGQQLVAPGKWPVIGEREPAESNQPWQLTVSGKLDQPTSFSISDLTSLKQTTTTIDIHCVTRWSKLDVEISGVLLADLLEPLGVSPAAKFVSFVARSNRNHSTSLLLDEALSHGAMIATSVDGQLLETSHGGPLRVITPGKYFYKSVKWLEKIELLVEDRLGFWEAETGYHNGADPLLEQRYMAPTIDRRTAIKLIESKDFSNRDLRSIDASKRDLAGLNAQNALLRDANFNEAILTGSDFSNANLSNSHFFNAQLTDVIFRNADLEGANLTGADLRGTDFSGCSLIGASFFEPSTSDAATQESRIDSTTVFTPESLIALTPDQAAFIARCVATC